MDNETIIEYTDDFKNDLNATLDYIKYKLRNINAGNALLKQVKEAIEKRKTFPDEYKEITIKNKYNDKYRMIKIRNFAVLYTLKNDGNKQIMTIHNFIYARRGFLNY